MAARCFTKLGVGAVLALQGQPPDEAEAPAPALAEALDVGRDADQLIHDAGPSS